MKLNPFDRRKKVRIISAGYDPTRDMLPPKRVNILPLLTLVAVGICGIFTTGATVASMLLLQPTPTLTPTSAAQGVFDAAQTIFAEYSSPTPTITATASPTPTTTQSPSATHTATITPSATLTPVPLLTATPWVLDLYQIEATATVLSAKLQAPFITFTPEVRR